MIITKSEIINFKIKDEVREYDMHELKKTLSSRFLNEYFEPQKICVSDKECDHNNWLEEGYVCKKNLKITITIEED